MTTKNDVLSVPLLTPLSVISYVLQSEDLARAIIRELARVGFVCVPRDASDAMIDAAFDYIHEEDGAGTWRAMVDAAESLK